MKVAAVGAALILTTAWGCTDPAPDPGSAAGAAAGAPDEALYRDVTDTHLPAGALDGLSMDARLVDVDADGDLDVVVANEFGPNILLMNDGTGRFTDESDERLPRSEHDSEDVGAGDFDGDGDPDLVVVSEDDQTNELYLNRGDGTFEDAGDRLPVEGTTNAVVVGDVDGDGVLDLLLGNNGQNVVLRGDGAGGFTDETASRLPAVIDVTQDLELGDVDGDGDPDLLVGNEGRNRLLLNDGAGVFTEAPEGSLPLRDTPEETREADLGDVDGDGDLDILFANVAAFVPDADPRNRLLLNDGTGRFEDAGDRLPADELSSFDGDLLDVDGDGDLDVITSNSDVDLAQGRIAEAPYHVYLNDGTGRFERADGVFPPRTVGTGLDVEMGDLDGDGIPDLYLASRGTADRLLLGVR